MTISNETRGGYRTSPARTMRAYDRLPRSVRAALQAALFDWATQPYVEQFEGGRRPGALAREIEQCDRLDHRVDARAGKVAPALKPFAISRVCTLAKTSTLKESA